jgi:mannan endo-1,6-alpha-mannosidase
MGVLEVLHGLLATEITGPVTANTGGTSEGNAAAGTESDETEDEILFSTITTADKAGAAVLTAVVVGLIFSAVYVMLV